MLLKKSHYNIKSTNYFESLIKFERRVKSLDFTKLLTDFKLCSSAFIIDFEQVYARWAEGSIILVDNDVLPRYYN